MASTPPSTSVLLPPSPEPSSHSAAAGQPSTPVQEPVIIVEARDSLDSGNDVPSQLPPLKLTGPSTPTSHTGLPIGPSSSISRSRSGSLSSSTQLPPTATTPTPTTPTFTRQLPLPGGAATLVIPNQANRLSVASNVSLTPSSPTSPSSTHIGNILAPASFFRPSRPSQQGSTNSQMSSSRSLPHSIGPAAIPSHRVSASLNTLSTPRKNGAIPDSAIPLASFAARRTSIQGKRISRSSTSSDQYFANGAVLEEAHDGDVVLDVLPEARPMASREPLLTPLEQTRAQQQSTPKRQSQSSIAQSPTAAGMRGSIEQFFRRSFSRESLGLSPGKERVIQHLPPVSDQSPVHKERKQARFVTPPLDNLSVMHPPWMKQMGISRATGKPARNYEIHMGANRFLFRGRAMLGGDRPYAFLGTLFVWCTFVGFWMGTTCVWWWKNLSPALAAVGAYLCLLTLSSLLATAFRDPGILPRELDFDAPLPLMAGGDSASAVPLPRELRVRDEVVRTKYCATCRTYRPPRASHCRNCDNCVDGCDHHCPWVNNCVGRRNYGSFIICLITAVVSLILILATSAIHLAVLSKREHLNFADTLSRGFGSAVCFAAGSIIIWPVGTLMAYHVRLLILNTTTIEQVRKKAHRSLGAGAGPAPTNPFTYGSWSYNAAYMLCRPVGYSWIEADAVALEDKRERPPQDDDQDSRWSRSDMA